MSFDAPVSIGRWKAALPVVDPWLKAHGESGCGKFFGHMYTTAHDGDFGIILEEITDAFGPIGAATV